MVDTLVDEKGLEGEPKVLLESSGDMGSAVACMGCDGGGGDLLVYVLQDILFDLFKECLFFGDVLCIGSVYKELLE